MIPRKRSPRSAPPPAGDLHARGLRFTAQRRIILDVVRATDGHPSAAVVYRRVRRRLPRVSLATVYRNLRRLAAEGLLRERADASGLRFDGNTSSHDHFTCVSCRRIYDVPRVGRDGRRGPRSGRAERSATAMGWEVLDSRVELYGRCAGCRGRRRAPSPNPAPSSRSRRRTHAEARP